MLKAVQFGAGNIGCGFIGQLLFEGGYQTTFIDANSALVEALNQRREYPLRLVSDTDTTNLRIGNLNALDARKDAAQITQAILEADLICVAVGVAALPHVAPALAAGIAARADAGCGPVDILLCENQWHAATLVRGLLEPHLLGRPQNYFHAKIGLVETVIGRMVPAPTDAMRAEDPLLVIAEPYKELPIARNMLQNPPPPLPGLIAADNFEAYEARKLYLHNMSHAALAYLGYLRGYEFIWQCADDTAVAAVCRAALSEVVPALAAEYGFDTDALETFSADLLHRFTNKALGDPVTRVAADPLRKLRPSDRLIGAANLCLTHDITPIALAQVIAAALRYDPPSDPAAKQLQQMRGRIGDANTLVKISGEGPETPLGRLILRQIPGQWNAPAQSQLLK